MGHQFASASQGGWELLRRARGKASFRDANRWYHQIKSEASQSPPALAIETAAQWCVLEGEQANSQHVETCHPVHHIWIPFAEDCSRARLQAWVWQDKQTAHSTFG